MLINHHGDQKYKPTITRLLIIVTNENLIIVLVFSEPYKVRKHRVRTIFRLNKRQGLKTHLYKQTNYVGIRVVIYRHLIF